MFAMRGVRTLVADLDPQCNLSSMFLEEHQLNDLWGGDGEKTILGSLRPLMDRTGDVALPHVVSVPLETGDIEPPAVGLVPGNLGLSRYEDELSQSWPKCLDGEVADFRVMTAFYRALRLAAEAKNTELTLIDVGPNLGAINRAALLSADYVIMPVAADLFSLQGLKNLGPTLRKWRKGWQRRLLELEDNSGVETPTGSMDPLGYVVMQHGTRGKNLVKAYEKWACRIPGTYREAVLDETASTAPHDVERDPHCLSQLKHYRSLMPMAMEARKPLFLLKTADGAIGSHLDAVQRGRDDFFELSDRIAQGANITVP